MKPEITVLPLKNSRERGGAGVKLIIVFVVLFLIGHAGYNYIPFAYQCEDFKARMTETVTQAYAMPNTPLNSIESVRARLRRYADSNEIPSDAVIKVEKLTDGAMRAHITFIKPIEMLPFGLYKYNYAFDNTAQPSGFMTK